MTPIGIEILLHYFCSGAQYRNGDFSAPAVAELMEEFCELKILIKRSANEYSADRCALNPYITALCNVPLPVMKWVIPTE